MDWTYADPLIVAWLFLLAVCGVGWALETYAPKLLDWIEKQVSR